MCGIFGYIGSKAAAPLLIEGLKTLEYRGYDSAGIYLEGVGVTKAVGPIAALEQKLHQSLATLGIAHTRWATHGVPSEKNAHPHSDASGKIWLVHNGIIENFRELREGLIAQGITFYSDTDTEVLAKLIGYLYKGDLVIAVRQALQSVRGAYGLVIASEYEPSKLIVARLGSPIVLGVGSGEYFIASDPSALLIHTKRVMYLEDNELAVVTPDGYSVTTLEGEIQQRAEEVITWNQEVVQKNGYDHFMLKEIMESPEVVRNTIRGRLDEIQGTAHFGGLSDVLPRLRTLERLHIVGCGSAYYAGLVGKALIESVAHMPVEVELGSEFRYKPTFLTKDSALLCVSQSGETADTRESLSKAKEAGALTLGLVNVVGSAIARGVDAGVYNHAGPEVAVASTKAFTSQLTAFALIAVYLGRERGMSEDEGKKVVKALKDLPEVIENILKKRNEIEVVAKKYASYRDCMYLGRGVHAALAYEGSLKLKEVSYIHAEAYAGGELKHGPLAMIDNNFPVCALVPKDASYEKMISNIEEVKARQAPVLAFATEGDAMISAIADDVVYVPAVHPLVLPVVEAIYLQLFAYYVGVAKGINVDRPRNLAKSVTVE